MLAALLATALQPATKPITVHFAQTKPISPYIYGANFPDWQTLNTPFTLARQGGNRMTAYNWENNASNAGADYRHQNDAHLGESNEPAWTATAFMKAAQTHKAAVLLTVPTAGYVSADKAPDGDVNQTPDYLNTRFHRSYASKPGTKFQFPPDLTDKAVYQDEFVAFLQTQKSQGTPLWFSLDNEPDLWHHTHSRIVPEHIGYADIITNNVEYASAIKRVAPDTLVFGPANYGWQGFRTFQNAHDANDRDFLDVYLAALKEAENKHKTRLLDVLDVHWYPEARGNGVRIVMGDPRADNAAARVQAPRSLWDKTYVEDSWIASSIGNRPIALLPNLHSQINKHYPGTKLAITEYDFGGSHDPSGTVAQADVLGLWGRYGLFAACHWGISDDRPATLAGFRAFLDFDGQGSRFGDIHIAVSGQTPEANAVYVSADSQNSKRLVIVAINRQTAQQEIQIALPKITPRSTRAYLANPAAPHNPKPTTVRAQPGSLIVPAPAYGVVTVEIIKE